jgi:serine phosphatase RsbU (regulator of sigma subunit)
VAIVYWQSIHWAHRRWLAPIIDRRFFRESYDAQQILTELAQSVRSTTNVRRLLELVAERIQKALHSENITIFLRDADSRRLTSEVSADYFATGKQTAGSSRPLELSEDSAIVQRLNEASQPVAIGEDGLAPSHNGNEALREVKADLLLPLGSKDGLLGAIALGPRAGDLPYSREDRRMLMNVAAQTALAIENTRLIERTLEQERRRQELEAENERRARELEEARQLQLSLLPKKIPQLPHLEIATYMKTATEVGGDYYDLHLAEDGTLTVAVGDATGHGLRAGTLVSSVKSLFVSLADEPDITQTLERMNRTLKQMSLRSLFMAMTLVKVRGDRLSVSTAGMPPVLLYRTATGAVEEVRMKALPLGALAGYQYQQQELALATGDVVVLMSDGLPERFNRAGAMLDYDATKRAFAEAAQQSPQQIIEHLVNVGEAWADGRAQDDDVTFVILKVKGGAL